MPSDFILDNVGCDGTENSLFNCTHATREDCDPNEGAGVVCTNITTTVELRNGSNPNEGNLFINGQPVCDENWDFDDANVACSMLMK